MHRVALHSSKTVALSCTAQNLTCSQEFRPRVPPSSDLLHASRAADVVVATQCLCPFFGEAFEVLRRRLHHHPFRALELGSPQRLPQTFPSLPAECVAPGENKFSLCPLVLPANESELHLPRTDLHPPTLFPTRRQRIEFRRVLTLHVFHNTLCQQAVQRFLRCLCLCLLAAPAPRQSAPVSSAASWSKIPLSSVTHLPVSSFIEALSTTSSARQYSSAGSSSSSLVVSTSVLFRVSASVRSISVLSPPSEAGSSTSSSHQQLQDQGSCS